MKHKNLPEKIVAQLDFEGCAEGDVLQPLEEPDERARRYFAGWETPLAPWGGFGLDSGFAVVCDEGRSILEWKLRRDERALVAGSEWMRDYRVVAEIKPIDTTARPHVDRADCSEAFIGIAFRVQTSRHHYLFGIEGRRRATLYRRTDDEWFVLAEQSVEVPDEYLTLEVELDGDGRDEILAGGTLLSAEGDVLWVHDRHEEMKRISGAGHYDAVTIGAFAEDESLDPVAFLVGGSAGVYVVDGLTGTTRMVHRVGHAQGRVVGKVRRDLPGEQVLVACRWGNMGILTLFSGAGDRLWTIQPDYIGQGSCPVRWGEMTFIWMNTTGPVQSFYDGYGKRVKELTELKRLWGARMRRDVATSVARMGDDTAQFLCLTVEGKMYVFGPG